MQDEDLRASCFAALDVLCARHGSDVPYAGGLDQGFAFRGTRVPFLNYQKGIYRSAGQKGPAALSVNTSYKSPYDDEETPRGFRYAYRTGSIEIYTRARVWPSSSSLVSLLCGSMPRTFITAHRSFFLQ